MENKDNHKEIFWFCAVTELAGLLFLAALIWIPVPKENQSMANIAIGFITASVIGVPLTYLLGGNIPTQKKDVPGKTTATIDATITSTSKDEPGT